MSEILYISTHSHLWFTAFFKLRKSKQGTRVSMSGTTDMTSWDLGQQEEDLENSKFRERAFHESIYCVINVKALVVCFQQWEGPSRHSQDGDSSAMWGRLISLLDAIRIKWPLLIKNSSETQIVIMRAKIRAVNPPLVKWKLTLK